MVIKGDHYELDSDVLDSEGHFDAYSRAFSDEKVNLENTPLNIDIPNVPSFHLPESISTLKQTGGEGGIHIPPNAKVNIYDFSEPEQSTKELISKLLKKEEGNNEFKQRLKYFFGDFMR